MTKTMEFSAKTIDEALNLGLAQTGLNRDEVSIEVLQYPSKGFLGIGAILARISITFESPDEAPEQKPREKETAPMTSAPSSAPRYERAAPSPAPRSERAADERPPRPEAKKPLERRELVAEVSEEKTQTPSAKGEIVASPQPGTAAHRAVSFLNDVFEKMGVKADIELRVSEKEIDMDLKGSEMGIIIGRRGETLDALQYLCALVVNKGEKDYIKVTIDTENYRKKREETLSRLAKKLAHKVQKYKRNITLEPMNPYERRIIHSSLQGMADITTFSTGTEPNRKVVISCASRPGRGGYRPGGREKAMPDPRPDNSK